MIYPEKKGIGREVSFRSYGTADGKTVGCTLYGRVVSFDRMLVGVKAVGESYPSYINRVDLTWCGA